MLSIFTVNRVLFYTCFINWIKKFHLITLFFNFLKSPSRYSESKAFWKSMKHKFFILIILDVFFHQSQSHNLVTCPAVLTKPYLFLFNEIAKYSESLSNVVFPLARLYQIFPCNYLSHALALLCGFRIWLLSTIIYIPLQFPDFCL